MAHIYSLTEQVRCNLLEVASHKDIDLRRVLGHAMLLDTLVAELSVLELMWDEDSVQCEHIETSEEQQCNPEDSDDLYLSYGSDTESDWISDTDSDSDTDLCSEYSFSASESDTKLKTSPEFNLDIMPDTKAFSDHRNSSRSIWQRLVQTHWDKSLCRSVVDFVIAFGT